MRLIFIMKEVYKKSHEMRRHSLFTFTSLRIALLKTIWKDIVGKFSFFGKEIYQKKEKKKEIWMFESGSTGWQVKIGQIWTGEGGLKIGNSRGCPHMMCGHPLWMTPYKGVSFLLARY